MLTGCITTNTTPHPLVPQPYKITAEIKASDIPDFHRESTVKRTRDFAVTFFQTLNQNVSAWQNKWRWDIFSFIAMGALPFAMFGGMCAILLTQKLKKKNCR